MATYAGEVQYQQNMMSSDLPVVSDPEATYATMQREDYDSYIKDYRAFEETLIDKAKNDTSLIDRAPEDAAKQSNISRYGGAGLSVAQRQQQQAANQRQGQLGLAGSLNTARVAQRTQNQTTLSELINIGQGVNRTANQGLATASQNAQQKASAYKNAKASHSSQMMGLGGSIASAAIMAFAI